MRQPLHSSSFRYKEEDPDYKGQPLELDYVQDPVERRPCTDLLCCIIFVAYICLMGYVAVKAYQTGDPSLLASPFDESKNQCGVKEGFEDYPKVYISNFNANKSNITFVCVKQCPTLNSTLQCHNNSIVSDCNQLIVYNSRTVVNICVPQMDVDFVFEDYDVSVLQEYFSDLRDARYLVLAIIGVSFVISIIYTLLMRWFAGCFLWTFIVLFIVLSAVIGIITLLMSQVQFIKKVLDYDSLPQNLRNKNYQIVCGCLCLGSALLTLIIVCCMKRQIKISIGIIKASSDFVRQCCSSLLIPLIISVFQGLFVSFWSITMLYLFSSKDGSVKPIGNSPFSMIEWNQDIQRLTIVYVIGLIWIIFFFEGLGAYWTSSTVAIWYFQSGEPTAPIIRSVCRSLKNLGSIAFGSIILTVVIVIKVVLEFISNKAKKSTIAMDPAQSAAINFAVKCAACLVACFQRVIRFLTQNAYIMMAITGKNFCASARQSFYLIVRCAGQFAISHNTTKFFIGLGKSFIVTLCCVIGYMFITKIQPYKSEIYEPIFLTIVFAIASYPIAAAFMTLFQMAANTLLVCYCIQIDLAKGRSRCPEGLKVFLQDYVQSSSLFQQIENRKIDKDTNLTTYNMFGPKKI